MSFYEIFKQYDWDQLSQQIHQASAQDVERVLRKSTQLTFHDFAVLISPAAQGYIEPMAKKSQAMTKKRFGNTMQVYAPLYLSNECTNICTYCGFSMENEIPRKTLNPEEILAEVEVLKQMGVDHVLLVTGEANKVVDVPYFQKALELIRPWFSNISIEVQPLDQDLSLIHI